MTAPSRQPGGRPRRLYPLLFGYEPIPESVSVEGGDPAHFLLEPVTGAAVAYDEGWVLLDSGFNVDVVRDPVERARHLNYESYTAIVGPGDPLVDQVADAGLAWRDLAFCAISHLHLDHTGGLRLLAGGPPVVLQEAEWEFGSGLTFEEALENAFFRTDYGRPGLTIETLDGDTELAPGLRALDTRGHTPGHQSFAVDLPRHGEVVLACDAADLLRNIVEPVACGTTTSPDLVEPAWQAARRLHELWKAGALVLPGHDPDAWRPLPTYLD